jgi:hypothetical protein
VYSANGGTVFDELDTLPAGLNINLTMSGLSTPPNTEGGLYSYPTNIVDQSGNVIVSTEPSGLGVWTEQDATFAGGGVTASLSTLSIFAPFAIQSTPPISIASASPNTVPENVAGDDYHHRCVPDSGCAECGAGCRGLLGHGGRLPGYV